MDGDVFNLHFVKETVTPLFTAAFEAVSDYGNLCPSWLDGATAIDQFPEKPSKNCCFIMSKFSGPNYEHFKNLGVSIYGPQVLLDYLREEKPLPNVPFPLFSTALRDAHVTVTSVTGQERERLFTSIEMLHGKASRDLTDDVNVVIAPKVGSKKYIVGASRGLHILMPGWMNEAWRLSEILDPINMMHHDYILKFSLPIFAQLVICVSGLSLEERREVSKIVSNNGGRYSGEMKVGETTHLIVKSSDGVKYNFAKKWKIRIVSIRWLSDSVTKGYALDEGDYPIKEDPDSRNKGQTSTPTSSKCASEPSVLGDISAITDANCFRVNDTRMSCLRDVTNNGFLPKNKPDNNFLSNCVIVLYGCSSAESNHLSQLVTNGGGVLCLKASDQVTESLTHVVLGSDSKNIKPDNLEVGLFYVTKEWLIACDEKCIRLPEDTYKVPFLSEDKKVEDPNPIDQQPVDNDEIQLINQYFGDGGLADMDDFASMNSKAEPEKMKDFVKEIIIKSANITQHFTATISNPSNASSLQIPMDDEDVALNNGLFHGFIFDCDLNFSASINLGLLDSITGEGGIINSDTCSNTNYRIYSYVTRNPPTKIAVTAYWITSCLAAKNILNDELETEIGFKPIYIPATEQLPLEGCVISLSGYVGNDRLFLTNFSRDLGATVQECFLRKPVPSRGMAASTHLIAAKPDGRKWPASQQWGLPAVSCGWLYACAQAGKKLPEKEFPVKFQDPINPTDWSLRRETVATTRLISDTKLMTTHRPSLTFKDSFGTTPSGKQQNTTINGLNTPGWVSNDNWSKTPSTSSCSRMNVSPPMSEQVARCLKNALSKTSLLPRRNLSASDFSGTTNTSGLLNGVIACVAKSLGERQVELNNLIKQLGGDFRWNFDSTVCTHMIADRAPSLLVASPMPKMFASVDDPLANLSLQPDVQQALEHGTKVVCPKWILECQRVGRRLPESNFDPLLSAPLNNHNQNLQTVIAPTVISSLLGDVTRRLESVMGKASSKSSANAMQTEECVGGDSETPCVSAATRRSRRAPRRALNSADSFSALATSKNPQNDEFPSPSSSSSNLQQQPADFAHPAQSLQVRWQYEDAPEINSGLPSPLVINENSNDSNQHPQSAHLPQDTTNSRVEKPCLKRTASTDKATLKAPVTTTTTADSRVFSLSGLNQDERDRYAAIISNLGGELDNGLTVSDWTTHLIVHAPSRSEKFLMSLASGKWILHKSYVDACAAANAWLSETAYEWGGPGTEPLLVQLSPAPHQQIPGVLSCVQLRDLARAARYWRMSGGVAFSDWRVIFGPGCDRETSFRRVIEIGGGQVLANNPPYPPPDQVTHAFYKKRSSSRSGVPESALPSGYDWLRFDFLCAHLTGAGKIIDLVDFALQPDFPGREPAAKRTRISVFR